MRSGYYEKKQKKSDTGIWTDDGCDNHYAEHCCLIPLASLVIYSSQLGFNEFIEVITRKRILSSFYVSFITALGASFVNAVMGLILAWVLVRYEFPGKRIMDGMIELPFALPTAVAGISLTSLTSDQGLIGSFFAKFGTKIPASRKTSSTPAV